MRLVKYHSLQRRRFAAWVASIAIALQALAPVLAFASAPARGAAEIEICTSQGIAKISVGADGQAGGSQNDLDQHVHHCVLCHSGGGAMPAASLPPGSTAPIAFGVAAAPTPPVQPPNPFLAWFVLRKHGPPLSA